MDDSMKTIYEIDFSALSADEKMEFMDDLRDAMKASFQEKSFSVELLAHTLIFTRWWNSYKYMAPNGASSGDIRNCNRIAVGFSRGKMFSRCLFPIPKKFFRLCLRNFDGR